MGRMVSIRPISEIKEQIDQHRLASKPKLWHSFKLKDIVTFTNVSAFASVQNKDQRIKNTDLLICTRDLIPTNTNNVLIADFNLFNRWTSLSFIYVENIIAELDNRTVNDLYKNICLPSFETNRHEYIPDYGALFYNNVDSSTYSGSKRDNNDYFDLNDLFEIKTQISDETRINYKNTLVFKSKISQFINDWSNLKQDEIIVLTLKENHLLSPFSVSDAWIMSSTKDAISHYVRTNVSANRLTYYDFFQARINIESSEFIVIKTVD